jgi:prophage antirepressor-like protein
MSNLINFNFENSPIRVVEKQGEPWFVANDVCEVLGIANARDALSRLDDDEKADVALTDISSNGVKQSRTVNIINESGLYILILRSRKATEKGTVQHKFRKWVTSEVLPSIHKTGSYSLPTPQTLSTVKDRNGLVKTCEWFVRVASYLGYDEVWNLVHHRFNINRACELTTEQVGQATEYLQGLLLQVIAQRRGFNPQTPLPLPPIHRADVGKYDNDGVLWTRVLEPDEQIVRTKDIPQLIINEPYIDNETLTAINYASSVRLASMLKNPPFLTTLDNAKEV